LSVGVELVGDPEIPSGFRRKKGSLARRGIGPPNRLPSTRLNSPQSVR